MFLFKSSLNIVDSKKMYNAYVIKVANKTVILKFLRVKSYDLLFFNLWIVL